MNKFYIIYVLLSTLGLGIAISDHGKERTPTNAWDVAISYFLGVGLVTAALFWS